MSHGSNRASKASHVKANKQKHNESIDRNRAVSENSGTTKRTPMPGLCSRFLCKINPGSVAYRYDIVIELQFDNYKPKILTDSTPNTVKRLLYKDLNRSIIQTARRIIPITTSTTYDNMNVLFAAKPLQLDEHYFFPANDLNKVVTENAGLGFNGALVKITPNESAPVLQLDVIKKAEFEKDPNMPLKFFLELATSEYAVDSGCYASLPNGRLVSTNPQHFHNFGRGIILRPGLRKGVSIVENNGLPAPCVDIEVKASPFFKAQSLLHTAKEIHEKPVSQAARADILDIISSIYVQPSHRRSKLFSVGAFTEQSLCYIPLNSDEPDSRSIVQYYNEQYGININYFLWPGIVPEKNPHNVYPIELLQILPNQTVPLHKHTDDLTQLMHTQNNLKPWQRYKEMLAQAKALRLFDTSNVVLSDFGIVVCLNSNNVNVRQFDNPEVSYRGKNVIAMNINTAMWSSNEFKYVVTKEITNKWRVYYPINHEGLVNEFIKLLQNMARKKSVFLSNSTLMKLCPFNEDNPPEIFAQFKLMKTQNVEYVIYIDSKTKDTDSHAKLKLAETLYKIISQQVTIEVIKNVVQKRQYQTLENIIAKSNIKFNGLNYSVKASFGSEEKNGPQLTNGDTLVFGLDVAHPKPLNVNMRKMLHKKGLQITSNLVHPSVVGISANMTENPEYFSGFYFFQGSKCEQIDSEMLQKSVNSVLNALKKYRPTKFPPKTVIILRDGLSEGQFSMAKTVELEAVKSAIAKFDITWKPAIALVIVTKRHFKRIYQDQMNIENPKPYTVADEKFSKYCTNDKVGESFAIPHYVRTSTAKPLQINVALNDTPFSRETLNNFIMSLSYSHQIINHSTALPQPIHQADKLAERGNNNYAAFRIHFAEKVLYKTVTVGKDKAEREIQIADTEVLNNWLSVRDTPLMLKRIV